MDYETYLGSDLMCGLNKHFSEDYLFRNFVSATNGTIDAVEFFTVNTEHQHLFTSRFRTMEYPTATAKLWQDAGYETSFVSGIEISWRNLMEVLPNQGFDRVMGKYEILKERPNVECNKTWGVYDHEMLSYLKEYLNENDCPKFVMALTSTSHTPFEFPDNYQLPDIKLSESTRDLFATSDDVTLEYLKGYQYENKALSDFLDKFKASEAAKNTIVVITGDHNIRQILSYKDEEQWRKYSVPLYMYLPDNLRDKVYYDSFRYGGHHDIIPTVASMTIAGATYFNTGSNLFDDDNGYPYHGANREMIISKEEKADEVKRFVSARRALTKIYFQRLWRSNN
jgi:phosphoglycerol transferase MdoB-like AlkP superfamily enzyme